MSPFKHITGVGSSIPLAVYRMILYLATALHFAPSAWWVLREGSFGEFRVQAWDPFIFYHALTLEPFARIVVVVGALGIGCGFAGVLPRIAPMLTLGSCYLFASANGLHVHTLALGTLWGVLTLLAIGRGGCTALTVNGLKNPVEPRFTRGMVSCYLLVTVFLAGVEKVRAGWPMADSLPRLLVYPEGVVLRDWAVPAVGVSRELVGRILEVLTLVVELLIPVWGFFMRATWVMVTIWSAFFVGIAAILEVPPLFVGLYLPALWLLLDDSDIDRVVSQIARLRILARTTCTSPS